MDRKKSMKYIRENLYDSPFIRCQTYRVPIPSTVSLTIDNNKDDTIESTRLRACLLLYVARLKNDRSLRLEGAISTKKKNERRRKILISPYPNCIISHASPSRSESWKIQTAIGNGNRKFIEFPRMIQAILF